MCLYLLSLLADTPFEDSDERKLDNVKMIIQRNNKEQGLVGTIISYILFNVQSLKKGNLKMKNSSIMFAQWLVMLDTNKVSTYLLL